MGAPAALSAARAAGPFSWLFSFAMHGGFLAFAAYVVTSPGILPRDRTPPLPLVIHPSTDRPESLEFERPSAAPLARQPEVVTVPELLPDEDPLPRLEDLPPPPVVVSAEPLPEEPVPPDALTMRIAPAPARIPPVPEASAETEAETVSAPHPAQPIRIDYPVQARRRGVEGVVEVEIAVDEAGSVTTLRVVVSSGHPVLDEAALRGLSGVRFTPAFRNGRPIPHTFRQPVRFVHREAR